MAKRPDYPYLPIGGDIQYVAASNPFMRVAKEIARDLSLDITMPTGSLVVRGNVITGRGANGSMHHKLYGCERIRLHSPTGQGYELCEGCHPNNHSELRAVVDALRHASSLQGAVVYLWGHWWCCEPCWKLLLRHGVTRVYLLRDSEILFNKNHSSNIVGRQFTA